MPVWNSAPAHFAIALESLLSQDFGDFELILSDNGSTDSAREMYLDAARRDSRIRLIRHDVNAGAIANFRFVLQEARGDFFMWAADDDDRSHQILRRQVEALDARPDCVSAGTQSRMIDEEGRHLSRAEVAAHHAGAASPARRMLALTAPWPVMDVYGLHRRQVLNHVDLTLKSIWLDRNIIIDVLLHGPIARIDEELFFYRVSRDREETAERRAYQHFGDAAASPRAQSNYEFTVSAFRQLATVLVSQAPLTTVERIEAFAALATVLITEGWFTRDELYAALPALQRAVGDRDLVASARLALRVFTLSPSFPFTSAARKAMQLLRRGRNAH
jgi:glycosyltransferase involved in cell wall biosynthesis